MYLAFNKERLGYKESEIAHPQDMAKFYPEEEIKELETGEIYNSNTLVINTYDKTLFFII